MGGAASNDRQYRKEGRSWWPEEMPSEEEMDHCRASLNRVGWRADYVVTHEAPAALAESCAGSADVSTVGISCKPSWASSMGGSTTALGSSGTTTVTSGVTTGTVWSIETSCRSKVLRPVLSSRNPLEML